MARRIIRLPVVEDTTGLGRSSIYAGIAEGTFPAQIPLGGRAVGWDESEVNAWIEQRVEETHAHASIHVNKACKESGIPPEELKPFIESGELPTYQLGRHRLVKKVIWATFQKQHAAKFQGA